MGADDLCRQVSLARDDVSIFDDYLNENNDISEENKEIIRSWKRCIQGQFMMERHLKKEPILISADKQEVYQVSGIILSWEEMFSVALMPLIVEARYILFKEVVISDGLIMQFDFFGRRNKDDV